MAMTGATIGKVSSFNSDVSALLNQRVFAFRPRSELVTLSFLRLLLESTVYRQQVKIAAYGGAQPNISDKSLGSFLLAVPPKSEQEAIIRGIERETQTIRQSLEATKREISLLSEYRTSLIANVVLGRVDVRTASVGLSMDVRANNFADEDINDLSELESDDVPIEE
jgi:type I restriction enzyme S subunit